MRHVPLVSFQISLSNLETTKSDCFYNIIMFNAITKSDEQQLNFFIVYDFKC